MSNPEIAPGIAESRVRFDTTRWSLVAMTSGDVSQEVNDALNELCRAYWRPIYAEIRRRGHAADDAQAALEMKHLFGL